LHVGVADGFGPATKAHPAFRVSSAASLEMLAARLEAHGHVVSRPSHEEIPGTLRLRSSDPWGNRIELVADVPYGT
jgi:hypothetical protein